MNCINPSSYRGSPTSTSAFLPKLKKDKISSHKKIIYELFIEAFRSSPYPVVYENFETLIHNALEQHRERLSEYETLKITNNRELFFTK